MKWESSVQKSLLGIIQRVHYVQMMYFFGPLPLLLQFVTLLCKPSPFMSFIKSDTKERLRLFWGFWLLKQSFYLYSSRCYSAVIDTCSVMFKGVNFIFCFVVCLWEIKLLFKVKKCYGKVGRKNQKSLF